MRCQEKSKFGVCGDISLVKGKGWGVDESLREVEDQLRGVTRVTEVWAIGGAEKQCLVQ